MKERLARCFICGKTDTFSNSKSKNVYQYTYFFCKYCTGAILTPRIKVTKNIEDIYNEQYFDWGSPQGANVFLYNIYLYKSYPDWVDSYNSIQENRECELTDELNADMSSSFRGNPDRKVEGGCHRGLKSKRILDVGAGTPDFVREMKNRGWDSYALELSSEQSRKIAKEIGSKKVYKGYFEKIKLPNGYFDAVTFWHVLEHVKFPDLTIKKARRVLNKGGKVYIEVPNAESLTWSVFGDYYDLIRVPEHLSYFSGKSIRVLLEQNQFKILEISYPLKLNSAFAASFSKYIRAKTGSSQLAKIVFYLGIPFSFGLSFIGSLVGRSEIVRVSAQKMI